MLAWPSGGDGSRLACWAGGLARSFAPCLSMTRVALGVSPMRRAEIGNALGRGGWAGIAGGGAASFASPRTFPCPPRPQSLCSSRCCGGGTVTAPCPCPSGGRNPCVQASSGPGPGSPFGRGRHASYPRPSAPQPAPLTNRNPSVQADSCCRGRGYRAPSAPPQQGAIPVFKPDQARGRQSPF